MPLPHLLSVPIHRFDSSRGTPLPGVGFGNGAFLYLSLHHLDMRSNGAHMAAAHSTALQDMHNLTFR